MSELHAVSLFQIPQPSLCSTNSSQDIVELGQHTLEILEEQAILLVDVSREREMVQLTREEAYYLLITLQELFRT